jgi:hypothetical protein
VRTTRVSLRVFLPENKTFFRRSFFFVVGSSRRSPRHPPSSSLDCRVVSRSQKTSVAFIRMSHRSRRPRVPGSSRAVLGRAVVPAPHAPVVGPRLRISAGSQNVMSREYGNAFRSRRSERQIFAGER